MVFSDLDGTLLDHQTYRYDAAEAALDLLRQNEIPLILCSSKTAAEIFPLRAELGFGNCPAIVENGAGLLPANASEAVPAATHKHMMQLVDSLPGRLRQQFSGISGWTIEQLQAHTGLSTPAAKRAARRDYSEPGLWRGDETGKLEFVNALAKLGVTAQQGGRFLTLGFDSSKAERMQEIIDTYQTRVDRKVYSIALGDAPNDIDLLQRADIGVIVPNPAHAGVARLAGESGGRIICAGEAGPAGWNSSLLELLEKPVN